MENYVYIDHDSIMHTGFICENPCSVHAEINVDFSQEKNISEFLIFHWVIVTVRISYRNVPAGCSLKFVHISSF